MDNIIVVGCGYLGYNLAMYLKEKYLVTVVSRNNQYTQRLDTKIKFYEYALEVIESIINEESIVIYAVGSLDATAKKEKLEYDIHHTYFDFIKILDLLIIKNAKKFIFLSSGGTVYGNINSSSISEETCLNPIDIYGLQKVYFEKLIYIYLHKTSVVYNILRVSNPYGGYIDKNRKQGLIPVLINKVLDDDTLNIWVDLNTTRDYIFIDDLSSAIEELINKNNSSDIFNVGSGCGTSISEIINLIEINLNKKVIMNNEVKDGDYIKTNILNIEKITNTIGFNVKTSIENGVKILIQETKLGQ